MHAAGSLCEPGQGAAPDGGPADRPVCARGGAPGFAVWTTIAVPAWRSPTMHRLFRSRRRGAPFLLGGIAAGQTVAALSRSGVFVDFPVKRGWAALPARPARVAGKPGCARLLHYVAARWVPPPLAAGLSGRILPPTPAFPGRPCGFWGGDGGLRCVPQPAPA